MSIPRKLEDLPRFSLSYLQDLSWKLEPMTQSLAEEIRYLHVERRMTPPEVGDFLCEETLSAGARRRVGEKLCQIARTFLKEENISDWDFC